MIHTIIDRLEWRWQVPDGGDCVALRQMVANRYHAALGAASKVAPGPVFHPTLARLTASVKTAVTR